MLNGQHDGSEHAYMAFCNLQEMFLNANRNQMIRTLPKTSATRHIYSCARMASIKKQAAITRGEIKHKILLTVPCNIKNRTSISVTKLILKLFKFQAKNSKSRKIEVY